MSPLETAALAFAAEAHASIDQHRNFTGDPDIANPLAIADLVRTIPHDEAMIAAACLHDVVEDVAPARPEFGLRVIEDVLDTDVADLVGTLTDVSTLADGNRAVRKAIDGAHSAAAPARAQTSKAADAFDSSRSLWVRDGRFARCFLPELAALLDVLVRADPAPVATARRQIGAFHSQVG